MIWEVSLLIASIAFLLLVAFLIPAIVQVKRTAERVEIASENLNIHLPNILTNLDEITTNLTGIMTSGRRQMQMLEEATEEIKLMVEDLSNFEKEVKEKIEDPLVETLATITAVAKAARAVALAFKKE